MVSARIDQVGINHVVEADHGNVFRYIDFTARIYADTPASAPGSPITPGVSRVAISEKKNVRRGAPALQAALPSAGGVAP